MSIKENNIDAIYRAVENSELIEHGQHIVLGLSGGPDSVCLFNVLDDMAAEKELTIHPIHVNHMIRGNEADDDQRYVEMICEERGLKCITVRFDCKKMASEAGITTEEAGRLKRYDSFHKLATQIVDECGVDKEKVVIATAHNADDQVETILFRILRGTGVDGIAGIKNCRESKGGFKVIRPLLNIRKNTINEYCEERSLNPCIDNTNEQLIYARNRIRLELIPYLKKYNPNIEESILRLGTSAKEDSDLLLDGSKISFQIHLYGENESEIVFENEIKYLAKPIYRRAIAFGFARLGLDDDITFNHYELIESVMKSDSPSASADLPRGYKFSRRYDKFVLHKPIELSVKPPLLRKEEVSMDFYDDGEYEKGNYATFDFDLLRRAYGKDFTDKVEIRSRQAGDFLGQKNGRKKIQDLFVDEKVPRSKRDEIFFVAIGSEVLFIPKVKGVLNKARYSSKYSLSENTKMAFVVEIFSGV